MPDQKISALAELTSADTADLLEIVDVGDTTMAATGTNKRITVANLKTAVGGSVATDALWDAKGDLAAGTGANTASKLTVGSNGTLLVADSGEATGLRWGAASGVSLFGDGNDGDVTISSNTTLTSDIYYNNLTVNASTTLSTGGFRVFVRGTLTLNGTIAHNGISGSGTSAGNGAAKGSIGTQGLPSGGAGTPTTGSKDRKSVV